MEVAIHKDLPIPNTVFKALYELEVGQCVEYKDVNRISLRSSITYCQQRYGKKFTVRTMAPNVIRVWRVM